MSESAYALLCLVGASTNPMAWGRLVLLGCATVVTIVAIVMSNGAPPIALGFFFGFLYAYFPPPTAQQPQDGPRPGEFSFKQLLKAL